MRTVSTIKPIKRFTIEKTNKDKCIITFFDDIKVLNNKLYEFQLYRLEAIYRPTLEKTINQNYNAWLEQAKNTEKVIEEPKQQVLSNISESELELKQELFRMQHRVMMMEVEKNKVSVLAKNHYENSPYKLAKVLIENSCLDYNTMLSILSDFVNYKYMRPDEFTELIYLMDDYYNKL